MHVGRGETGDIYIYRTAYIYTYGHICVKTRSRSCIMCTYILCVQEGTRVRKITYDYAYYNMCRYPATGV